jgi:hypothetical protein
MGPIGIEVVSMGSGSRRMCLGLTTRRQHDALHDMAHCHAAGVS